MISHMTCYFKIVDESKNVLNIYIIDLYNCVMELNGSLEKCLPLPLGEYHGLLNRVNHSSHLTFSFTVSSLLPGCVGVPIGKTLYT